MSQGAQYSCQWTQFQLALTVDKPQVERLTAQRTYNFVGSSTDQKQELSI